MIALADLRLLLAWPLLGALCVTLAPTRWSRAIGAGAAALALLVALLVALVEPAGLALRVRGSTRLA